MALGTSSHAHLRCYCRFSDFVGRPRSSSRRIGRRPSVSHELVGRHQVAGQKVSSKAILKLPTLLGRCRLTGASSFLLSRFFSKSFVMSTAACTAVAFVAGALAWWGPKFIALGLATQQGHQDVKLDEYVRSFSFQLPSSFCPCQVR